MSDKERQEDEMSRVNCPPMAGCISQETNITNVRLATAYVPFQKMCKLFSPMESLKRGTIFPELYRPWGKEKKYKMSRED